MIHEFRILNILDFNEKKTLREMRNPKSNLDTTVCLKTVGYD